MKSAPLIRRHVLTGIYEDFLTKSFIELSQRKNSVHVPHSCLTLLFKEDFLVRRRLLSEEGILWFQVVIDL